MDFTGLYGADDATAQEQMQAQAAALRRQSALGVIGQLTGDKVLGGVGSGLFQNAQHQQDTLNQVPGQRLKMALERQQQQSGALDLAAAQRRAAALQDPNSPQSVFRLSLGKRFGYNAPAGTAGEAIDPQDLALAEKAQEAEEGRAERLQAARIMANARLGYGTGPAAGGAPGGISDDALNALADGYATSGKFPNVGYGQQGTIIKRAIVERALQRHPGLNPATAEADFSANQNSLKSGQKQADQIDAFEKTAIQNLDNAVSKARQVVDVGSPFFNAPFRAVQQKLMGSPQMAAYMAARQVAISEVSKVLSGAMNNGSVSDSARHEVEQLISPDASMAQIESAVSVLKQDMANRKAATHGQLDTIRGRISGKPEPAEPPAQAAQSASVVERRQLPDGRIIEMLSDGSKRLAQ